MNKPLIKTSKFMSLLLRHKPETIGLILDDNGWAKIDDLIHLTQNTKTRLSRKIIENVVKINEKQRFIISDDNQYIRANQGHSINIDLKLVNKTPPAVLYHGTATRFFDSINKSGLTKQNRQHVHLSSDVNTATLVGTRHGKPIIFIIDALKMYSQGYEFFLSENNIWLTDHVPPQYLNN